MLNSNIAVVGHFSIDSIMLPARSSPFVVLGGPAAYVSLAARRLGATTAVISKVGSDFPKAYSWWLEQEGIDLSSVLAMSDMRTTRFELRYTSDLLKRELQLTSRAAPITVEDLPKSMKAKVVHIAPIADEVPFEVVEKLKSNAGIVSLDPQGLVREFDEKGNVRTSSLKDKRILGLVDIYKSSLEEITAVTDLSDLNSAIKGIHDCGVTIVIVTLGADGVVVSVEDKIHHVPACVSDKFVDPTGAGDVFIGSFLAEYVRGEDCSWCSYVGAAAASVVMEGVGPTALGDKEEIYRRARLLSEKEIKHDV